MPNVTIDDQTVHYEEFGAADAPLLVILHGLMGDGSTVAALAERFADRFHVVTPDALGHGRSAHPESFTIEDQGRMLNGLVVALGYGSAVTLGISMGSYLLAQAAILDPSRTSRLVLVVSKAHGTTSSAAAFAARRGVDLSTLPPEQIMALLQEAVWSPHTPEARRAELLGPMGVAVVLTPEEQARVEASLAGFDLRPGLATLPVPTLVVSGASDGLNPPESGREIADLVPDSRFLVYEHSGHMLASEETDRLVADVLAFVG
jgi:pimeloyl-ACP methyl ester carboxylesterase